MWHTKFLAFFDGDQLCGVLYMAAVGRVAFIMFFAVAESLRSRRYGSRILKQAAAMYPGRKLIVSIEPCDEGAGDYPQRIRRKRFYEKNGYRETGYFMKLAGQEQEVLIRDGDFDKGEFIRFFLLYSNCTIIPKLWRAEPRP